MSESAFGVVHKAYTPNPKVMTELHSLAGQIAKPKKKLTRFQVSQKLSAQAGDKDSLRWAKTQEARNSTFGKADDDTKRNAAIAGAAVGGAALYPAKYKVPVDAEADDAINRSLKGKSEGKVDPKHLRKVTNGVGPRFSDRVRTARLARKMRRHGFDEKNPIQLGRTKQGNYRILNGNHRLRASEMIGRKDVPVSVAKDPVADYKRLPIALHPLRARKTKKAREPQPKMSRRALRHLANTKTHPLADKANNVISRGEELIGFKNTPAGRKGIAATGVAGAGAGGAYVYNKSK